MTSLSHSTTTVFIMVFGISHFCVFHSQAPVTQTTFSPQSKNRQIPVPIYPFRTLSRNVKIPIPEIGDFGPRFQLTSAYKILCDAKHRGGFGGAVVRGRAFHLCRGFDSRYKLMDFQLTGNNPNIATPLV
jgi:hypothetical protein